MSDKTLKIGIIGAGGVARNFHVPGWRALPNVSLVAVADINPSRAQSLALENDIPHVFTDFHDLLKLDLDAVDICTPNQAHTPAVMAALNAGKHVLCEKPLAVNTEEVRRMGELADLKGLILMTAHQQRYAASALAIRNWALAGNLGEVYHARIRAMRRATLPCSPGFIDRKLSGGGPCMDIGVHALDIGMWLMGFPKPVRVSGATKVNFAKGNGIPGVWGEWNREMFSVEDFASGFIHFENGATMSLEAAWLGHQQENEDMSCQLFGMKGGVKWPSAEFATVQGGSFVQGTLSHPRKVERPHNEEIRDFHHCILGGKVSPIPWRETLHVIGILEGIYRSQVENREIYL